MTSVLIWNYDVSYSVPTIRCFGKGNEKCESVNVIPCSIIMDKDSVSVLLFHLNVQISVHSWFEGKKSHTKYQNDVFRIRLNVDLISHHPSAYFSAFLIPHKTLWNESASSIPQMGYQAKKEHDYLLMSLKSQAEFYFSRQNLSRDYFLQQLLASPKHLGAVPASIVTKFPKMMKIYSDMRVLHGRHDKSSDIDFLYAALKGTNVVSMSPCRKFLIPHNVPDFEPNHSSFLEKSPSRHERLTVIVRDLSCNCTSEELLEAFTVDEISPKDVKCDFGDTWYIHFSCEKDATTALIASWGKTIKGIPLQARMKNQVIPQSCKQTQSNIHHNFRLISPIELSLTKTDKYWDDKLTHKRFWDERKCIVMSTFVENHKLHVDASTSSKADGTDILKETSWPVSESRDLTKQRYRARKHKRKGGATRSRIKSDENHLPNDFRCEFIKRETAASITKIRSISGGMSSKQKMYRDTANEKSCIRILLPLQATSYAVYSDEKLVFNDSFKSVGCEADSSIKVDER